MKNTTSLLFCMLLLWGCKTPQATTIDENKSVPDSFNSSTDTTNSALTNWREFFPDPNLIALIDTALANNQELNILLQEIAVDNNEILARKGEYLPFVNIGAGAGLEKDGEYTRHGAVDESLNIREGQAIPEPLPDFMVGAIASWELDFWKKLRNGKKAAVARYLSSVEGRNFMVTNLIAEISNAYYELMALDNQLEIIQKNIAIQRNALRIIEQQKQAAQETQLAVNRFAAQLLNTENLQYDIKQKIVETENWLNFLVGRFPQPIVRSSSEFNDITINDVQSGIPSQLLTNRPDIKQAELALEAAKLDVSIARANFYPSFSIEAGVGFGSFNPKYLLNPQSILYNLGGDLMAPLVNRNAIKATYNSANARQLQAVYNYEQTILQAYIEVANQLSQIVNSSASYTTKAKEVDLLNQSITISNSLFRSARADYMEVLLTQREALESRMELIEIKLSQMNAKVNVYKALGGGWN
ncbi:TolC family protein [Cyclobacterium marinum]|uniref:RND efflux system, outer membrane lipoprotein, NodT family n=1 Tax=Cyclobacterium marinum (strain ATCC 25205 / DSM 745 / LMG 13164 / NCIMB 1802) TaxID=880070 RepID=G0J834_CYCMS|nr:RND efflux system, outer membrane lipoprotein, NodT family [Cyclobacterium marinum DSM 745]